MMRAGVISLIRPAMIPVVRFVVLPFVVIALAIAGYYYSLNEFPTTTLTISAIIVVYLLLASTLLSRSERKRGWRLVGKGRDEVRYEELVDGQWIGFDIYGELLVGHPSRVIAVWDEKTWPARAPAWARHRRAEIVTRIGKESERRGYALEETSV